MFILKALRIVKESSSIFFFHYARKFSMLSCEIL